jgi:hypothetical protein
MHSDHFNYNYKPKLEKYLVRKHLHCAPQVLSLILHALSAHNTKDVFPCCIPKHSAREAKTQRERLCCQVKLGSKFSKAAPWGKLFHVCQRGMRPVLRAVQPQMSYARLSLGAQCPCPFSQELLLLLVLCLAQSGCCRSSLGSDIWEASPIVPTASLNLLHGPTNLFLERFVCI